MKKLVYLMLFVLLFLVFRPLIAEYQLQWSNTINKSSTDQAQGITVDNKGYIYVTGYISSADCYTVKYDSGGSIVDEYVFSIGPDNYGFGITADNRDNIYVAGSHYTTSDGDFLTIKYDSTGNLIWFDTLYTGNDGGARAVAADFMGNVYITGFLNINSNHDFLTAKYDSLGNIIWMDTLNNGGDNKGTGITVAPDGNIYVAGYSYIDSSYDFITIKYNSSKNIAWIDTLDNGLNDAAFGIALDGSGDIYVTGYTFNGSNYDYITVKYDTLGNIIWTDTLDNGNDDIAFGIAVDNSNSVYVTGYSYIDTSECFLTVKYDSLGNIVWTDTFDNGEDDRAYGVAVYNDNIYVTGYSFNGSDYDYLTVRYKDIKRDVGVLDIYSPNSGFISPGNQKIKVDVKNYGNTTESFELYVEVADTTNGWTTIFKDSFFVSDVQPHNGCLISFPDSCDYQPNAVYLTRAYVSLPDTNAANDTAEIYSSTMHYPIMFVEDAESYGAPYHPDSTWYVPLINLVGSDSVYWYLTTDENQDGPDLAAMEHADLVIWNTYDDYDAPCFTDNDTTNINDYINEGGKVWLIGQDLVLSLTKNKSEKRNRLERTIFSWLDKFGVDSVIEDYLEDTVMTIQGTGQVAGDPISVHSDFNTIYDGNLYPDIIYPDTSAQAVLIDPDSSVTIGIITNDSKKAFWTADGRGADLTPGGDWETLIDKMLSLFGITHQGINEKAVIEIKSDKTSLVVKRTVNTMMDFSYRGNRKAEILVSDINGRIVKRFVNVNPGSRLRIESNTLTAGIYFITVKGTDVRSKVTVIK